MAEEVKEVSVEEAMAAIGHNDGKADQDGMKPADPEPNRAPVEDKADDKLKDDEEDKKPEDAAADADAEKDSEDKGEDGDDEKDTSLEEEQTEDWGSTGDENGDAVLTMLQEAKVTQAEAEAMLFDAVKAGDPEQINRAMLEEKVGKAQATLIISASTDFMKANAEKVTQITKTVHDAAGGEENWKQVSDWSAKNMTDAERGEYAEMIDAGGLKAKFAAEQMITAYNKDSKNTTLTSEGDVHVGDSSSPPAERAISRAEMVAELETLHNRTNLPHAETMRKDREIRNARKRGQAQGL